MTNLDQSQLDFCQSDAQNIRLLAPAGCGKTNSLLYRCRELGERSDSRQRFLIVTFTKVATAELKDRLISDPKFESIKDANTTTITTLNAYGDNRIRDLYGSMDLLSTFAEKHFALRKLKSAWVGNPNIEPIVGKQRDGAGKLVEVMDNMKSMGFVHTRDTSYELFRERIHELVNQGMFGQIHKQAQVLTDIGLLESPDITDPDFYNRFFTFWLKATPLFSDTSVFTFEDQKYWTYLDLIALGSDGKPRRPLSGAARYHHVLVDEFQDINPLDLALTKAIVDRNQATLTIVGDDDQAIFQWRGATPEYILNPSQYFDVSFKYYILGVNYRSPKNIVELSQRLISNNENRVDKKVRAADGAGTAKIEVKRTRNIHEQLEFATDVVKSTEPGNVGVIGRLQRQLIPHQIYFASDGAPFKVASDLDIFASKGFGDFVTLLDIWRLASQEQRAAQAVNAALTICSFMRRFPESRSSKSDNNKLKSHLQGVRPSTVAEAIDEIKNYSGPDLSGKPHTRLHNEASKFVNANSLANAIINIKDDFNGLRFDFQKSEEDIYFKHPPLEQLAQIAESEELSANALIGRIETCKDQIEEYRSFEQNSDTGDQGGMLQRPLHLMTAPRSKGKEFDTVIILDAVEGIWPYRKTTDQQQLEEERRLFYVAFTRARKRVVFLTEEDAPISPFLKELGLEEDAE